MAVLIRLSDCDAVAAACASRTTLAEMLSAGIWFKAGGIPAAAATLAAATPPGAVTAEGLMSIAFVVCTTAVQQKENKTTHALS